MKLTLITGASRGLGKEIAHLMAERGYSVLTPTRAEMDLSDVLSIHSFASRIKRLDVLINNAAILGENMENGMQVNAMAPYHLTTALWPAIKASNGRVINVSSREGLMASFGGRNYSASKSALNAITRMLSRNEDNVTVAACCPGWFRSGLGGDKAPRSAAEAADTPVWLATEAWPMAINGKFFINREGVPW